MRTTQPTTFPFSLLQAGLTSVNISAANIIAFNACNWDNAVLECTIEQLQGMRQTKTVKALREALRSEVSSRKAPSYTSEVTQ